MNSLPQTHHQKLVEVANTLQDILDYGDFEEVIEVVKDLEDHLLYYDTLTNPS